MRRATWNGILFTVSVTLLASCSMGRNSKTAKAIVVASNGDLSTQSGTGSLSDTTVNSALSSNSSSSSPITTSSTISSTSTPTSNNNTPQPIVWVWTNTSPTENPTYIVIPTPTPLVTVAPTTLFDLDLFSNQWVEFNLHYESVLVATASARFSYTNGGGGSAVIDLERYESSGWVNFVGTGHCGSDSIGSATGPGSSDTSFATCQERLSAGRYRIRALEGHFTNTTAVSFQAHFNVLRRVVPEMYNGLYTNNGTFPSGTVLFDSPLLKDGWKEIILSQNGVLFSHTLASFNYQGGGGGTTGIDLQALQGGVWISVNASGTCATDSYIQSTGSTIAVESTAHCSLTLNPGLYRLRAWEQRVGSTGINYFRSSALVLAQ